MRDKKHIDRLFKEGLKDFEPAPSHAVWENIEAELNKDKRKRRIVPIWWRYAGVAALILVFLTLGINNTFFSKSENLKWPKQEVGDTETTRSSKQEQDTILNEGDLISTDAVIADSLIQGAEAKEPSEIVKTEHKEKKESVSLNSSAIKNKTVVSLNSLNDKEYSTENSNTQIVTDSDNGENDAISSYKAQNHLNSTSIKNSMAETTAEDKDKASHAVVDAKEKENGLTIEEALDKASHILVEKKEMDRRWSIAANAAPVYFNTSGEGSAIDPQFNNNSKSGEIYISYGISASYALTDRLSIRSGISNLSLGYNTDNVVVYESAGVSTTSSKALQNVSSSKISTVRVASDVKVVSGDGLDMHINADFINESRTSINQNLRYVEVPIELQYALIKKKIGVNVIGGFSSLFLNGNEIFTDTDRTKSYFSGEASNINKVSYSANFGVGLNYQVSKKVGLNLEPMFKYQINTFKNTFGDFQPFYVGVYTGVAIKF